MDILRMIWTWIKRLWHRPVPDAIVEGDQQHRRFRLGSPQRAVRQRRLGPFRLNMPQYQPCPAGHGWKRRREKTVRGATYWCEKCRGVFFVRA